MKVLVTGATGLLGRAVVQRLKEDGHQVVGVGLTRSSAEIVKLDLTDAQAVRNFLDSTQPDAIVHTAAERRPDVVENSPDASRLLNVEVPKYLAQWCKDRDGTSPLLINISTDYVFDGVSPPFQVDDPPNPLNAYGMSKWQGEKAVQENGKVGRVTSLRVPVLYGRTETNAESAVNVLLDALTNNPGSKPKKMDANAVRYPTSVSDVATALSLLCSKFAGAGEELPPLLHFSAMEAMTKYDMCLVMARSLRAAGEEAETNHLEPEYEVDPNAATTRPRHCKLDLSVIKGLGIDVECVSFEAWWREYLQEYAKQAREQREKEAAEAAALAAAAAIEAERLRLQEQERREEEERLEKVRQKELEQRREQERIQAEQERQQKEREQQAREIEQQKKAREQQEMERQRQQEERQREDEEREKEDTGADEREGEDERREEEREKKQDDQQEGFEDDQVHEDHARQHSGENESVSTRGPRRRSSFTEPTSPNPSFSSLRARPTPPATSGRSSPSPSVMSGNAMAIPHTTMQEEDEQFVASASTSLTETAIEVADRQVDPLVPSEQAKFAGVKPVIDKRGEEKSGFFPAALASTSGASSLGIDFAAANARGKNSSGDADSDGYGHPSPRDMLASASSAPFTAGYGEVQYGLSDGAAEEAESAKDMSASQNGESDLFKKPEVPAASFQIRVGDPQKIGDPMTAHIVYTVRIKTDCPGFKASQFSVLRRYSDFRWLHAALVHNNPGIFIPPVPEKVKLGRFAPDLVEARRHGLETCINKIANNIRLQGDEDLKLFLESGQFQADVKVRDQIKGPVPTPEQKTYFGWSTSLTGNSYKYYETDEWFDEQRVYLDHLETHLKNLVRVISNLSQQRKDMAGAISDFSHAIMMLSGSSLSRSLSTCFAGLGEVQRRTFELADVQADADVREFASVIYEYERMVGSARKAFSTRLDAWQAWQKFEDESRKIKVKHEKLKREAQGNHRLHDGRLSSMLEEVVAADTKCLNQKREFDLIGLRCKDEMSRFEWDRIKAFEQACEIWLQGMIERNEELMAEWEQYAALLERQTGEKVAVD